MRRFERLNHPPDIDRAIEWLCQVERLAHEDDANKPVCLNNLGISYLCRFERHGELSDLNQAIECLSQAVRLTLEGNVDKPARLINLGNSFMRRFERQGELLDIDQAIEYQSQAVQLTLAGNSGNTSYLNSLGSSHVLRFKYNGDYADIDKAIEALDQAMRLTLVNDADKLNCLNNLGSSYMYRFKRSGNPADVNTAIEYLGQALQLTSHDHRNKLSLLNNLGTSYMVRFESYGELSDIKMAIVSLNQSVNLTPFGHADKPARLNGLGNAYRLQFDRREDTADINAAIECHTQAVQLTPDDHSDKPGRIGDLGCSFMQRFAQLGELGDIDMAIKHLSRDVRLTPDGHVSKPVKLGNLGTSFARRFKLHGDLSDIDSAIEHQTQAVCLTAHGLPEKPAHLSNLGNSLLVRFKIHGELSDLDEAIECQSQAVQLTPDNHLDKPAFLSNLGNSHLARFERHGELMNAERAIECHGDALRLTADGDAAKPVYFGNLGQSYLARFECHRALSDVDKSIEYLGHALQLTPDGHAEKPGFLNNLGNSYLARFEHQEKLLDLRVAFKSFKEAALCEIGSPQVRFTAARQWAHTSNRLRISPLDAYSRAMELVPQIAWIGTTINKRYVRLLEVGDVAREAAYYATSLQAYERAFEWLEEGRSVIWNQILQLRTPFDELCIVDPPLGKRLKIIALELEHVGSRSEVPAPSAYSPTELEKEARRHHRLATEWDQLLMRARQIPGFDNFMQPRKADVLMRTAKDGPIIVINMHCKRCDALIIIPSSEKVDHISLENFTLEKAIESRAQVTHLIERRGDRARGFKRVTPARNPDQSFKEMLATLWWDVVKPILDHLGYKHKLPVHELPHVTWCTTGPLSFLPLHAAGCYDGSQPNAYDLVVSSYTPTLSALLSISPPVPISISGVLAVGQKYTKGLAPLPNTVRELEVIEKYAKNTRYLQLDDNQATVDAVLNAMHEYSCIHLACHATQNREDPSRSAFHLHDGDLKLSILMKQAFENKTLAFLSACQTATGDEKLPDEAVHLAAGMLMTGYPSIIGTMWAIQDEDAPEVAGEVYADLLKDGTMNCAGAARALHKAVAGLREKVGEDAFERWVPFLHIGR